jgi:hypothetical protein
MELVIIIIQQIMECCDVSSKFEFNDRSLHIACLCYYSGESYSIPQLTYLK